MPKKNTQTTKPTLLKLHGTPFKNAADLKSNQTQLLKEEWQNIERARIRRSLLMKSENREILAPLMNGLGVKFVGPKSEKDNLITVYLTDDESVQVEIDSQLKGKDNNGLSETLVKSLVSGLMDGYFAALGLKKDPSIDSSKFRKI